MGNGHWAMVSKRRRRQRRGGLCAEAEPPRGSVLPLSPQRGDAREEQSLLSVPDVSKVPTCNAIGPKEGWPHFPML